MKDQSRTILSQYRFAYIFLLLSYLLPNKFQGYMIHGWVIVGTSLVADFVVSYVEHYNLHNSDQSDAAGEMRAVQFIHAFLGILAWTQTSNY